MELLPGEKTGIRFSNELTEDENLNILSFEYFYNGAGVGIVDINNDGFQDIFFAANMKSNRLYLNKGEFKFQDITNTSGLLTTGKWATGVSVIDINQDNLMDIYVCYAGPFTDPKMRANELYINNGNNTFSEQADKYGLADTGHSVQAAFFDYDNDGDLDVYLLTNTTDETGPNVIRPKRLHGEMINTDRLYRNNGNATFTNVSKEAGVTIEGYGLGVSICDINRDGWSDVYVSNDYLSNDLLYINNHDGTFTDRMSEYFKHTSYSAMGNDVADFNNDALPDVIAVDMLPPDNKRQKLMFGATNYDRYRSEILYGYHSQYVRNTLQLNEGQDSKGKYMFSEIGQLAGVEATDWSWSPLFADIDNDGWKDLLITNGYARDITNRDFVNYKMNEFIHQGYNVSVRKQLLHALQSIEGAHIPPFCFKNNGNLTFMDKSPEWGFNSAAYSTGAAYGDLDNDGDLDWVTNNINSEAFVYENHSNDNPGNNYLRIKLNGQPRNLQGLGTKVTIYYEGNKKQYQEKNPYRGYLSSIEQELHFGLHETGIIDSVLVQWPTGNHQTLYEIKANQMVIVNYNESATATAKFMSDKTKQFSLFQEYKNHSKLFYKHQETEYADFKIQPLLPHKYSENGPGICTGDINGDGLDDLFAGGAYGNSGQIFIQNKNGEFSSKPLTAQIKYEEDMGCLLFDADGDGDNDLYIVSGGNEFAAGSKYYRDRLYLNDGKGNFIKDPQALPNSTASGSCVVACDFDNDGDLDLFVGGRLSPHQYPKAGTNMLLINNGGIFSDGTASLAPELKDVGMVTSALWSDIDNDRQIDLIIAGEWMPITYFKNENGKFRKNEVKQSTGWWNSICGADFDEDGDTDYVLGNLGLNSKYKTSTEQPVCVYVQDINNDGSSDAILTHYLKGINRPFHPRDDLFLQVTQFKKKYPSYSLYSDAQTEALFDGSVSQPEILKSETFHSSYLENKGNGEWKLQPLPLHAQFAPVYGIVTGDYDGDGHLDLVLTGNSYAPDVLTGRYDAFNGLVLKGNGSGEFKTIPLSESGMLVSENGKSLVELTTYDGQPMLIAAQNNDSLRVFISTLQPMRTVSNHPNEKYAILTHINGKEEKREFYYGSGYLSQSSRKIHISDHISKVKIFSSTGKVRVIDNL